MDLLWDNVCSVLCYKKMKIIGFLSYYDTEFKNISHDIFFLTPSLQVDSRK